MVVPAPDGKLNPLVLAAAQLAGVDEIYRVGGAQAVAALAYGTETIAPVAKIVGPGQCLCGGGQAPGVRHGRHRHDRRAVRGADPRRPRRPIPDWIAADLLAQAEHDAAAQSILITDDAALADAVERAVERQLKTLPRASSRGARRWRDFGAIILVATLDEAVPLVDAIAPEHLEIDGARPRALLARRSAMPARSSSARHTPEAIGDYVAGSNHVLPTARSARFSSGLGVLDFMKRTSILRLDAEALGRLGPAAIALGEAEGLDAHARSVAHPAQPTDDASDAEQASAASSRSRSTKPRSARSSPDIEHERAVAIYDLLEDNSFAPADHDGGPYALHLSHRRQPARLRHPLPKTARR